MQKKKFEFKVKVNSVAGSFHQIKSVELIYKLFFPPCMYTGVFLADYYYLSYKIVIFDVNSWFSL